MVRNGWAHAAAAVLTALLAVGSAAVAQTTVSLTADKDNTLYEDAQGDVSNAQGVDIFAGRTDVGALRRAVVHFNLNAVPPGSTVTAATLQLRLNRAKTGTFNVTVHRALADWGEGTSLDTNSTGQGTAATAGDATWLHRFFPNQFWAVPGGDFVSSASASTAVGSQNGLFQWSGAGLIADVQAWVNTPANNFGWVVRGTETQNTTARRFDSSEAGTPANRPTLTITYTPPASPTGACCFGTGACAVLTQFDCGLQSGLYQGDATVCSPNPCPQPTGACCLAGAVCVIATEASCLAQSGLYQGHNTLCTPNPCTPTTTVTLNPVLDNTLFESATGALSNGAGQGFFTGTSGDNPPLRRRGLVAFNVSSLPSNALVTQATLTLWMGDAQDTIARTVSLHRVQASWGEGTSDAAGNERAGAAAATNDATWLHRFFNTVLWPAPGATGSYVSSPSASTSVGTTFGDYQWTGGPVASDVQSWIAAPSSNFGWTLVGDETTQRTFRRFDSREGATPANRPRLTITYTLPTASGACCAPSGSCTIETPSQCVTAGGVYQGDATLCTPNPCPQPSGACCLSSGNCVVVTATQCIAQGGTYQGNASMCDMVSCPILLTPYVDALPRPGIAQPTTGTSGGAAHYDIAMLEVNQRLHRDLPLTRVWGYAGSYPGPTIEARRGQPVTVTWSNQLRELETGQLRTVHYLPVDTCLHGPDMTGSVPVTVVHLHGAKDDWLSDGQPELTFPPGQQSFLYTYPNDQPAGTIWYHDHALGITRLNVYMGLAAFYLIRDDAEDALNIPRGEFEIPMAIQDRSFHPDGRLKYPEMWHDHFFGDFLLVNGKVWPYLEVKRGKYRFRLLNGSGSRAYTLALSNNATFWQIGTDQGLLPAPVPMTSLTMLPGERCDVVMDFAPYAAGTEIILTNSAASPFPSGGMGPDIPNVMKFVVLGQAGDTDPLPPSIVPVPPIPESEAVRQRDFVLRKMNAVHCGHAGEMWAINDLMWDDITEFPLLGTTEIWAWVNRSGVSHPMHMHLVAFQVLDRQDFQVIDNVVTPVGPRVPPPPAEAGWKDTVRADPGQITRVIARFEDFPGRFPYHCHILEHEDHEMMRQFETRCPTPAFTTTPASLIACRGQNVMLSAVASAYQPVYAWRRNGVPLVNGPTPSGSVISGADTSALTITGVRAADAGSYDCRVIDRCETTITSAAAALSVCAADFNCSGSVSVQDIFDFLAGYFAGAPLADFNDSGTVSVQDIFDFLAAYFAGCG